jgi:hypothetical protein
MMGSVCGKLVWIIITGIFFKCIKISYVADHGETRERVCGKKMRLYRPVRGLVRTAHT